MQELEGKPVSRFDKKGFGGRQRSGEFQTLLLLRNNRRASWVAGATVEELVYDLRQACVLPLRKGCQGMISNPTTPARMAVEADHSGSQSRDHGEEKRRKDALGREGVVEFRMSIVALPNGFEYEETLRTPSSMSSSLDIK